MGACIKSPEALAVALERLDKDDFSSPANAAVFVGLGELFLENVPVSITTLENKLRETKSDKGDSALRSAGGRLYLVSLVENCHTSANVGYDCAIVKNKSTRRQLGRLGLRLTADAHDDFKKIEETIAESETRLLRCAGVGNRGPEAGKVNFLVRFEQQHGETIFTGIEALDNHTGGLNRGEPCIIAARPSVGKTSLCLQISRHTCSNGKKVIVYTYETTKRVLEDRLVVGALQIDRYRWKTRRLLKDEIERFADACNEGKLLKKIGDNILIDESRPDYRKFALSLKLHYARFPFDLVIVDYVQQMALHEDNRDVADAFKAISDAAARHNVPIIALSQLHRPETTPGNRYDPKPRLTDLRGSGTLEQGARVVLCLWNKCAGIRSSMPSDLTPTEVATMNDWKHKCRFILAKNSEGEVGEWEMAWEGKFGTFTNLDQTHRMEGL